MEPDTPTIKIQDTKNSPLKTLKPIKVPKKPQNQKLSRKATAIIAIIFVLILSLSSSMTIFVLQNVNSVELVTENPERLALAILTGNGFCDDATNTNAFNFDEGDCCLPQAKPGNCMLCTCHLNGKQIVDKSSVITTKASTTTSTTTTSTTTTSTTSKTSTTTTGTTITSTTTTGTTTTEPTTPCKSNWVLINGKCYLFVYEEKSITDAELHCKDQKAIGNTSTFFVRETKTDYFP